MAESGKRHPLPPLLALVPLCFPGLLIAQEGGKDAQPIPMEEVARHDQRKDCWLAIDGQVYDVTDYLPRHPGSMDPVLPWCGREATRGWETRGDADDPRAHSSGAHYLLRRYHLGPLAPEDASDAPGEASDGHAPGKKDADNGGEAPEAAVQEE